MVVDPHFDITYGPCYRALDPKGKGVVTSIEARTGDPLYAYRTGGLSARGGWFLRLHANNRHATLDHATSIHLPAHQPPTYPPAADLGGLAPHEHSNLVWMLRATEVRGCVGQPFLALHPGQLRVDRLVVGERVGEY